MAVFSDGGLTSPDVYIGLSCICLSVICSLLNFLVFLNNFRKKSSVARNLFLCLSAADFITVWVILVPYSFQAFKGKDEECRGSSEKSCNEDYFKRFSDAKMSNKLQSIVSFMMVIASCHFTAFMAITRHCQIKDPFRPLKSKHILTAAFLSIAWGPVVLACSFLHTNREENKMYSGNLQQVFLAAENPQLFGLQFSWRSFTFMVGSGTAVLQIFSLFVSSLTIFELVRSVIKPTAVGRSRHNRKSTFRILVTNFGSFLTLLSWIVMVQRDFDQGLDNVSFKGCIYLLFSAVMVPPLLSTINPIIYLLFTNGCSLKLTVSPQ